MRRPLIARSIGALPERSVPDEPTTGLDPSARLDVWELIDGMRAEALAIALTHQHGPGRAAERRAAGYS